MFYQSIVYKRFNKIYFPLISLIFSVLGIRLPQSPIALAIEKALGHPILTTSIEGSDDDFITEPELIAEHYGHLVDIVVDGGRGDTVPSTIVDCTGSEIEIVREGKGVLQ